VPVGPTLQAFAESDLPDRLRVQVARLEREAWPGGPVAPPMSWFHDPALDPLVLLLVEKEVGGEQVLASLAILRKQIRHVGETFVAVGLSAVTTRADLRGRGLGHQLVAAARERVARSGADLGIFTCDRPLQAFYERAGWQHLPGTVIVGGTPAAPFRSDQPGLDKVTMAAFFTDHARTYQDEFAGAEVELYPGEIDRLW
jgi:aminoglycoside 2'-N-acetyltransferase I